MNSIEGYVTCPFNKSHRIINHRFQKHLSKCRKNYPKNTKVVCPFDASHMLNPEEYENHLSICSTSGNIKCYQYILDTDREVGTISLEEACNTQTNFINEDWSGNNPTYDPKVTIESKNIIRPPIGMSKSKKKQFKQYERNRILSLENKNSCVDSSSTHTKVMEKQIDFEQPLQAPKNLTKTVLYDQDFANNLICKLNKLCIKEGNNLSEKDDMSIVTTKSYMETDFENHSLKNSIIDTSNVSSISKNISKQKDVENVLNEENDAVALFQNILEVEEDIFKENNSKMQKDCKEINIHKDVHQPNLNKGKKNEVWKINQLNPRTAKGLYREVNKISTGRGFTTAYQYLNSSMIKSEKGNENSEDFSSIYGYDMQ
ncbi:Gametocyte-specific factor 1 [Eufriesea mexicana]|uniref:Gametocyte-specific factor 1 n=1 Tax=Eufriesea mexicana TaxID=516756 RepID=A0A310SHB0_9HYME|nr:PREDICTED: uncharacterized protein LOC108547531 [Eufriesea mexicana]OAD58154.1 Gametocyte-specific factor 1 [Eufriesea mexicana]